FGVTGLPLFSLKGWNKPAQGTALGVPARMDQALKGRNKDWSACCCALSGLEILPGSFSLPGRCPGLSCLAPSGREKRQLATPLSISGLLSSRCGYLRVAARSLALRARGFSWVSVADACTG